MFNEIKKDIKPRNEIGEKHGYWLKYHNTGKIAISGNYINGKKDGEWKQFYANGKILCIGKYKEDEKIGSWEWFDEDGSLFNQETF